MVAGEPPDAYGVAPPFGLRGTRICGSRAPACGSHAAQDRECPAWWTAPIDGSLIRDTDTRSDITMGIIGWILLGLIAGAIAKAIHPGDDPGGILATIVVGVLGAVVGGLIASAVGLGGVSSFFSLWTWIVAIGGALLLLAVYRAVAGSGERRTPHGA